MKLLCRIAGHKWPTSDRMPVVAQHEAMKIRCERCGQAEVVEGWLREAFELLERK